MTVSVMKTIDEHIQKDQEEFLKALSEHNEGKVRHLTEELQWLLDHKKEFPDDPHDPWREAALLHATYLSCV